MAFKRQTIAATATAALLVGGSAYYLSAPASGPATVAIPSAAASTIAPRAASTVNRDLDARPAPTTVATLTPSATASSAKTTAPAKATTKAAPTLAAAKKASVKKSAAKTPEKTQATKTAKATQKSEKSAASSSGLNLARAAMWDRVARCESGGNWSINTGNGYYGGLQFNAGTWRAAGGTAYASLPHQASRAEQITVANRLYAQRGLQPWGCAHAA